MLRFLFADKNKSVFFFSPTKMDMDDDVIQEILASQDGTELAPTDEMMMMNSATVNDIDVLDPELASILQQSTVQINPPTTIIRSNVPVVNDDDDDADDDDDEPIEDETFLERVTALKEMFPESLQKAVGTVNTAMINTTKSMFSKGRTGAWWYVELFSFFFEYFNLNIFSRLTSTLCVLVFPILIQKELLQVAEQISREQRSILLGPQAATGAFNGAAF